MDSPADRPRRPRSASEQFHHAMREAAAWLDRGEVAHAAAALGQAPPAVLADTMLASIEPTAASAAPLTRGHGASAGAAVGRPAFSAAEAVARAARGESVILVRPETYAPDMEAIRAAAGVLTTTGAMTSHAAYVARGWGKPCVTGACEVDIDPLRRHLRFPTVTLTERDELTLDGHSGAVHRGALPLRPPALEALHARVLDWADSRARLRVLANADAPAEARLARALGARGIGLCRTEHMFFRGDRLTQMRRLILAPDDHERAAALAQIAPHQAEDFEGVFEAMAGMPVTVRLLDPPLHEFLPAEPQGQADLAAALGLPTSTVSDRVASLHETNPMMGLRGCRLSLSHPDILRTQVRAIALAFLRCKARGIDALPRILHPLVTSSAEMHRLRSLTLQTLLDTCEQWGAAPVSLPIGAMIETPRAALVAGELAAHSEFLSFGTNDLTQFTFALSRDDSSRFVPAWLEQGLWDHDPFVTLDTPGVGRLLALAAAEARRARPGISLSLCGEHAADPASVRWLHGLGIDEVSCSPLRVPVARLAAAQAVLLTPA